MSQIPSEPEFQQALNELTITIAPFLAKHPEYERALEVVQIPERIIQFRVVWENDKGEVRVNRGYRVQFNSTLGPYKGGLRLHPTVNLSILKFLGFEQIFKNALTGLNMGGAKGGSDFDPKGKSDNEIRRFCYSFMAELSRHIGQDTDVPAGDIGVGGKEVAYLFGAYKKIRNEFVGVLTGKGEYWGGSYIRPEATGYGLIYYVAQMLPHIPSAPQLAEASTRVLISGSGNVAQYAALKLIQLGASVLSLSDSKGSLIAKEASDRFTAADVEAIQDIKANKGLLSSYSRPGLEFHEGKRPWTLFSSADIALPCATQNEVSPEEAQALVSAGVRVVAEGSNMGCTQEAIDIFEQTRAKGTGATTWYAPGKASNAGGVAVSGLEMAQNSARLQWTHAEVDKKLKDIMESIFVACAVTGAEYSLDKTPAQARDGLQARQWDPLPSLVVGANINGFQKVADGMRQQGDWW